MTPFRIPSTWVEPNGFDTLYVCEDHRRSLQGLPRRQDYIFSGVEGNKSNFYAGFRKHQCDLETNLFGLGTMSVPCAT